MMTLRRSALFLGLPVVLVVVWWFASADSVDYAFPPLATIVKGSGFPTESPGTSNGLVDGCVIVAAKAKPPTHTATMAATTIAIRTKRRLTFSSSTNRDTIAQRARRSRPSVGAVFAQAQKTYSRPNAVPTKGEVPVPSCTVSMVPLPEAQLVPFAGSNW